MKPRFFVGIGAQKCASTWLYDVLSDHPQAALSARKELDFFSYTFTRGYQWYQRQWQLHPGIRAFGEISPSYFCDPAVPPRLKAYDPSTLIVVSLRDPVERAISNHMHEVRIGNLIGPNLSFEFGLENNPMYIEQSRYGTHLLNWLEYFPRAQLLITFMDDIVADKLKVAIDLYRFLDIDQDHRSAALSKRSNESHFYRFRRVEQARRAARRAVTALGMDVLWEQAQALGLRRLYRRINRRSTEELVPPVSLETRNRLREMLRDEIKTVEDLTGRSLVKWTQMQHERPSR